MAAPRGSWRTQRWTATARLRAYFAGLVVLVGVAALAGALYVRAQSDDDANGRAVQEASFAAGGAAQLISGGVTGMQTGLGALAADAATVTAVLAHPHGCVLTFSPNGVFATGHVDIVHSDGRVACTSLRLRPGAQLRYPVSGWAREAGVRPQLLAPVPDPANGEPSLVVTLPVRGGFVAVAADLREVGPQLLSQLSGLTGLTYMVASGGGRTLLASSTAPERWVGRSLLGTGFYRARGRTERPGLDRTVRLFAAAAVPGLGWQVFAGIDRSVALHSSASLFDNLLWLILAAVALVLIVALAIERRIERELERRRAAEAAARAAEAQSRSAEAETAAASEAYQLLFSANPLPMWIYDPATLAVLEANQAALTKYGYSREEFLALTIAELRPPEDVPAMLESVRDHTARQLSGPWRHQTRDGKAFNVEIVSSAVRYRGRDGRFVVAIDVTDRERLQQQLAQAQRLESLGQLAGGVAHDFNNLLGVIINYAAFVAEQLSETAPDAVLEAARADLAQIDRAAHQATRLTRQLLAFARREVAHPEVVDLNKIVRETEQLLTRSLGEHVELTTTLAAELSPVLADPGQLEQVLVNLAVNARDAMPSGGTLLIETRDVEVDRDYADTHPGLTPGRYARLRVSDTGVGMEPTVIERAFEPFFTTKPAGHGTGLGLATIYGIVTQLGGRVSLYSEVGIGTTCSVMLPAATQPAATATPQPLLELGGDGQHVLLVEDEEGIREVARRILERHGYLVQTAASGAEALELAATGAPIELLLTDVIMPGMLGKELAERILERRPETRVLYMSGYASPMLGMTATVPPGMHLVEKPFTEQTLLAKVREALAAPASVRTGDE